MLNKKLKKVIAFVTMFATVLCFSSVSMLALPLSAQAATAIVDGDIVKTNAINSDGTPAISSLDVYIVKTVGSKKFKRLVLNPNIFASYSHLKWENLKTVSQAEIDVYTTSSLVRVDGNDKVYAITPVVGGDTGAKSWINLTAAQFLSLPQSDPDSIYTINSTDGAAYSVKTDITTVAQLTAFYADGTLPGEQGVKYRTVKLFYYDYSKDECNDPESKQGLVPVERQVQDSGSIEETIKNTINLWLEVKLTSEEEGKGIDAELKSDNTVKLTNVSLSKDGILSVTLSDPQYETGGGSCHAGVLYSEFAATLKQFSEVKSFEILPKGELFNA